MHAIIIATRDLLHVTLPRSSITLMYRSSLTTSSCIRFFFFNDPATTEIYTLSLHDALPISPVRPHGAHEHDRVDRVVRGRRAREGHVARAGDVGDRKSTRLNSSHVEISYAVFCLKKKKTQDKINTDYRCMPSS